ncbi:CC0125/CC1285 family lipoprotein [Catenovulum maritimum]|uniref:Lipoprotein n=1 Tax=Catenovulum maritimum TaxID=1513271 RepID=A0A0J8JMR8_9ALTE|nr:hypothetical protein [Catenovulum maritimum]KMT65906.1 hypothetical protein XM47_05415 [Catenovulum maritimum]
MKTSAHLNAKMILVFSFILLAGCAAKSEYKPANNSGYGYQESLINADRYRVQFKTRGDDRAKVADFALLRAAELTVQQGYDWFIVVSKETVVNKAEQRPNISASRGVNATRECGLLGCKTSYRPSTSIGVGFTFGDQSNDIESILEIKMGKAVRPDILESYNAQEIVDNMTQKYKLANTAKE